MAFLLMKSEEIQQQKGEEHLEKISELISTEPGICSPGGHIQSSPEDRARHSKASLATVLLHLELNPPFLCPSGAKTDNKRTLGDPWISSGGGKPCPASTTEPHLPEKPHFLILLLVLADDLGGGDAHLHPVHHELACALQGLLVHPGILGRAGRRGGQAAPQGCSSWAGAPRVILKLLCMKSTHKESTNCQ